MGVPQLTDDDFKALAAEFDRVPAPVRLGEEDYERLAAELRAGLPYLDPVGAKRLAAVRANLGLSRVPA